jgi:hypothetical protein
MGTSAILTTWFALVAGVLAAGCVAPGPRGEIPLGEWTGRGEVIYESWEESDEDADDANVEGEEPRSIHRCYATELRIQPGRLEGHEVVEMEIRSHSGPLPGMEKETRHLRLALLKARRVSDSTVLYRLVDFQLDPDDDETFDFDDNAPPLAATCMVMHGATILQIDYLDNFVDTLRFQGNRVEKLGVYFDRENGLIHWAERLTRK